MISKLVVKIDYEQDENLCQVVSSFWWKFIYFTEKYISEDSLITALENKEVDGILIDSVKASAHGKKLKDKHLKISR